MENVYIGARYVPKFANPVEWSAIATYEPLTIVTHQGASYTSRTFVPSGTPLTDPNYWVITGNYNAQIDQYRQEVSHFDNRLTDNEAAISELNAVLDLFQNGYPERIEVEGDWSSAAFWLAAHALGNDLTVTNLNRNSVQGDKAVAEILSHLRENITLSAADIPDLVPILSVVATANRGATFTDIARLRLKESDRVAAIIAMLESLGGKAEATENTLTIHPATLTGGVVHSFGDHRIAMSAAIAATICTHPVTILGAECVTKSYPKFWDDYPLLGGQYEKQLR